MFPLTIQYNAKCAKSKITINNTKLNPTSRESSCISVRADSLDLLAESGTASIKKLINHTTMHWLSKITPIGSIMNVKQMLNTYDSFSWITIHDGYRRYGLCVFSLDSPYEEVVYQQLLHIKRYMNNISKEWAGCIYFGTVKYHRVTIGSGSYVKVNDYSNHCNWLPMFMTTLGDSFAFHNIDGLSLVKNIDDSFTLDIEYVF
jgi:hypothetical protein